ncbi:unnamed protein product [Phyllotreta striolata]|uniref:Genetic suppressor element-like domain-containing protein n=1 Tax=Phyllotreta striolata TaxID=444603 RepID=A0A9N9TM76_PHYSR|nr:unnamed protein product [Phyllotreta striolata]
MDLAETMKNVLAKGIQQTSVTDLSSASNMGFPGAGYVTEKLYMLLQLYLQNKGWNPSVELLQCFTELKETSMLPSAAYLQMMASRVTLDTQGRLILRENGKIILPFEHFANAVMLKHMNGPHGLHLGVEATVRAVMDSYTIGRENFGMEKEFVIEVVQNCPNPACRYYKSQMELTQKTLQHLNAGYLGDAQSGANDIRSRKHNYALDKPDKGNSMAFNGPPGLGGVDLSGAQSAMESKAGQSLMDRQKSAAPQPTQQQITAALIQQQNRVIAQQNIEKLNANLEKQRQQMQLQQQLDLVKGQQQQQQQQQHQQKQHFELPLMEHKITDFLRANLENLEALHNGAWTPQSNSSSSTEKNLSEKNLSDGGQEKIVRAFGEVMKNMARMKTYVRPAMCKPYGKQSEALQKTLMDTIQLIQSLRSFLPPPHIQVSSWKNEDKHRYEDV